MSDCERNTQSLAGNGEALSRVRLARSALDSVLHHARSASPNECCGVLLGRGAQVEQSRPIRNLSSDSSRYYADPLELLRAEKDAAAAGLDVLGHYHSHPIGDPTPSRIDRDEQVWPDLPPFLHLIASPDGRWAMYNTRGGVWKPLDVDLRA